VALHDLAFNSGRGINSAAEKTGCPGQIQIKMARTDRLPNRCESAAHFKEILLRRTDASGIGRDELQG
jgi:hypothetical protein